MHDAEFGDELHKHDHAMKLVMSFALAVTTETSSGWGDVARHGERSLLNTIQRILPQVRLRIVSHLLVMI